MSKSIEIGDVDSLGKLLASYRASKGLTRAALSEMTAIKPISILKYEQAGEPGGQYPPLKKLAKLALALEIDANLLIAACLDTDDEVECWWNLHKDQGANVFAKFLMSAFEADKTQARQLGQFLMNAANEKPEKASLATSSSGSNPIQPPMSNKEPDDG